MKGTSHSRKERRSEGSPALLSLLCLDFSTNVETPSTKGTRILCYHIIYLRWGKIKSFNGAKGSKKNSTSKQKLIMCFTNCIFKRYTGHYQRTLQNWKHNCVSGCPRPGKELPRITKGFLLPANTAPLIFSRFAGPATNHLKKMFTLKSGSAGRSA